MQRKHRRSSLTYCAIEAAVIFSVLRLIVQMQNVIGMKNPRNNQEEIWTEYRL